MKKENKFEKVEDLKGNQESFEKDLIELYKTNRLKKVMVGALVAGTLFAAGANSSFAQTDNNIGVSIRIPITTNAESLENGIELGVYGQHVKIRYNNSVYGEEAEVFYAPFSSDVGADVSGIYGNNDGFGKLGAGYSLKKGPFGKLEGQYRYLNLGTKTFLNGGLDFYIGANTAGGFDEHDSDNNNENNADNANGGGGLPMISTPV